MKFTVRLIIQVFKYISWPSFCGALLGISILQYQQIARINLSLKNFDQGTFYASNHSFANSIRKASPSVVGITATRYDVESVERASDDRLNFYLEEQDSLGSGVIVSEDGFILTNLHVVDNLFDLFDTEVTLNDGRKTPATVIAWDKANDLAVLHINMDDLTAIEIGDSKTSEVGDLVFAIGYPRNIGQSVSQGIISAITHNTDSTVSILQTDAAINPGNSGGALIDINGKLIGINSSIFSESGKFEGIGFATPVGTAIESMRELITSAIDANSGYLGVITGEALTSESSKLFFGVDHIRGILVESVDNGGSAKRAGIEPGDVITKVEGSTVVNAENILKEIRNKKPGDIVDIQVFREGKTLELITKLGFGEARIIDPQNQN